jgi:tryptophanyl-tRNA synthetase
MYPVLMAADILIFNANQVPVGRDQIQHIEMARDIGQRFNHIYGGEYFMLPEAAIEDNVATLPGLDGRKMSKSYDNTIPLFGSLSDRQSASLAADMSKSLRDRIASILTDSRGPGEPKEHPEGTPIFQIYKAFASDSECAAFRKDLLEGMAWGEAKTRLFQKIDWELSAAREKYLELITKPERIEEHLKHGAEKARSLAQPFVAKLREAVGLRSLSQFKTVGRQQFTSAPQKSPWGRFVGPYREEMRYKFRLENAKRKVIFVSREFATYEEAKGLLQRIRDRDFPRPQAASIEVAATQAFVEVRTPDSSELLGAVALHSNPTAIAIDIFMEEREHASQ